MVENEQELQAGNGSEAEESQKSIPARAGDVCEVDGKPGVLQADAGGHLVCVVDAEEVKEEVEKVEEVKEGGVNGERHPLA